jgi:hypothetical protein
MLPMMAAMGTAADVMAYAPRLKGATTAAGGKVAMEGGVTLVAAMPVAIMPAVTIEAGVTLPIGAGVICGIIARTGVGIGIGVASHRITGASG